jgi:hypothetical protein
MADTFDITDTRHEIKPCPKCQASTGMGLVTRKGLLAMECVGSCDYRGVGIAVPAPEEWDTWSISSQDRDRLAFEAWNAEAR